MSGDLPVVDPRCRLVKAPRFVAWVQFGRHWRAVFSSDSHAECEDYGTVRPMGELPEKPDDLRDEAPPSYGRALRPSAGE
jgi:hypothetical protein